MKGRTSNSRILVALALFIAAAILTSWPLVWAGIAVLFFATYHIGTFAHSERRPSNRITRYYQESGLTKNEIDFFRKNMAEAKDQIQKTSVLFRQNSKLKALELNKEPLAISKDFFKKLVRHPERLNDASDFLYVQLPLLLDTTVKFDHINSQATKTAESYNTLEKVYAQLEEISVLIKNDYDKFCDFKVDDINSDLNF